MKYNLHSLTKGGIMKRIMLIVLSIAVAILFCFGQQKINERQTIDKSHIDFTTQYIYFVIHGQIEIDGHTFYNDTCKSPIIFQATLDGVTIIDTLSKKTYKHRVCDKVGCKIIHLSEIPVVNFAPKQPSWWYNQSPLLKADTIKLDLQNNWIPCTK
jgi:hypothetical protein